MKRRNLKILVCLILTVLLAAAALTGCAKKKPVAVTPLLPSELGTGETTFTFAVKNSKGETASCQIHTDEETVGDALQTLELISGDESEYGLYVKTVCGETLDYDTNGMYWAFYVNGAYADKGVDQTPIVEGTTYSLEAEKG